MTLAPNQTEKLGRARGDLRLGLPIVLAGEGRTLLAAGATSTMSLVSNETRDPARNRRRRAR